MAEQGRFLTGSTMGHVARMTLAGAMGITFVFLVDAANLFWVSQLGAPKLVAAIGFAFAIQFFSVSSGIGLMIAAIALIARGIGKGDREQARRHATSSAAIAFVIQTLMAGIVIYFRHDILAMVGATGETAALAARYLAVSLPSLGIMAISMIANGALRAEGAAKRSMFVTLISGMVSMVLDPFLIYQWGLDGAAMGLNISRFVMLVVALRFAVGTHDLMARLRLADVIETLRPFLIIAVPAIMAQMAMPVGNYLLTSVMAPYGDDAMAGWAVVGRLTVVAFGGIFSLSGAIGGIFGQNYGAGNYERLRTTYRDAIIFGLAYSLVTWIVLASASSLVISAFDLSPLGGDIVASFTTVGAGAFLMASALFVSNSAFNALGRPSWATLTNWLRDGVISLPLAILLAGWYGATGVIYAQAVASVIVGALAGWLGWRYVVGLGRFDPDLEIDRRPHTNADRFRRR
ncbi:MAG: putative MATE family efflux protein [Paracoccaceae bacterium]|jgi:putative MATE family efflux protein